MKQAIITTTIVLLLLPLAIAQEDTKVDLTEIQIKTLYLQEEAKTRAEMKQYFANQRILLEKDLQKSVDENFAILDKRQDKFLREAAFKLGIVFFSGLIAGGLVLMLIHRKISKKNIIKTRVEDKRHKEEISIPIPIQEIKTPEENLLQKTPQPQIKSAPTQILQKIQTTPSMKEANYNG